VGLGTMRSELQHGRGPYGRVQPRGTPSLPAPAQQRILKDANTITTTAAFTTRDLEKLDKRMVLVAAIGLVVNVVQMVAISNHAWLKATALANGQPFTAHLSLQSVQFGNATALGRDNKHFCVQRRGQDECSLSDLCARKTSTATFSNGISMYTPAFAWCKAAAAGALATKFLFSGLLLGLAGTGITGMYAAQSIPWVAAQFDKVEELGFSDIIQKYIIMCCWGALWLFVFSSMVTYAMMIPDSLGWGAVELEASFGLLRVCFVLISINAAIVAQSSFGLWSQGAMISAWNEFMSTPWLSTRKALFIELALQVSSCIQLSNPPVLAS